MPSTVLDSDIFRDMFGTAEMRGVFSDDNLLKCYVEAEVALAVAQGRSGVIPQEAADGDFQVGDHGVRGGEREAGTIPRGDAGGPCPTARP